MAKLEQKKFAHRRGVDLFFSNGPKVLQALSPFEFKSNFFSKDSDCQRPTMEGFVKRVGGGKESLNCASTIVNNEGTRLNNEGTISRLGVTCTTVGVDSVFQLDV